MHIVFLIEFIRQYYTDHRFGSHMIKYVDTLIWKMFAAPHLNEQNETVSSVDWRNPIITQSVASIRCRFSLS